MTLEIQHLSSDLVLRVVGTAAGAARAGLGSTLDEHLYVQVPVRISLHPRSATRHALHIHRRMALLWWKHRQFDCLARGCEQHQLQRSNIFSTKSKLYIQNTNISTVFQHFYRQACRRGPP